MGAHPDHERSWPAGTSSPPTPRPPTVPATNFGWITDFSFGDAALYHTITYRYTNQDTDGSRGRFMGVVLDGIAVPTVPPTIFNVAATAIQPTTATIGAELADIGGSVASVIIYWGDDDAGTAVANWDNAVDLGNQDGAVPFGLSGLTPATTYYFRAFASNAAGEAWAASTASFTSGAPPDLPSVINAPATNITGTAALAGGEVTSTGGDPPTVTIYYGVTDGGTDAGTWDESVALGLQDAGFSSVLSGLSPLTTYYFRASAQNFAGISWASSTWSFTTLEVSELVINEFMAANDGGDANNPNGWFPIAKPDPRHQR